MSIIDVPSAVSPGPTDDPLASLLGGSGDMSTLVQQMVGDDPLLSVLAQRLLAPRPDMAPEDAEPVRAAASPLEIEAVGLLEMLRDENERLREIVADLGGALGACPECIGMHHRCPRCRGRGRPGTASPDPDLFRWLVAPVVQRLRRAVRQRAAADPQFHPTATTTYKE